MVVRAAVRILSGELEAVGRIVRRPGASLILTVLGDEQSSPEGVGDGGKSNPERVAIAPRERLDGGRGIRGGEVGAQNRSSAHPGQSGALERFHRCARPLNSVQREPAGLVPRSVSGAIRSGVEDVVTQDDVLTRNVWLVGTTSIVVAGHAGVRGRALRPVDKAVPLEGYLLGGVISRRQS